MASEGASRVMTLSCNPTPANCQVVKSGGFTLEEIVSEDPLHMTGVLSVQPEAVIETLKKELQRLLLGGSEKRTEFTTLQKLVAKRLPDLTADILPRINRAQLEILVAIRTGIQGFLHPDVTITQGMLAQIFLQKRCRNIACQAPLPANDCACKACSSDSGFCNMCMCISCFTFDFEANTCRWVGCDFCLHWCHSDCALHLGDVGITTSCSSRLSDGGEDLHYLCPACGHASELFGFVSDVFQNCASAWKRDNLSRELACVERMFQHSTDPRGQRLSAWAQKLQMHLDAGVSYVQACKVMQRFFAENMTILPRDPPLGLNISTGPAGHVNQFDGRSPSSCGFNAAVAHKRPAAVCGGAGSQSEAASSPVCRRNNRTLENKLPLPDNSFPIVAHPLAGPIAGNGASGGLNGTTKPGIPFSVYGLVSEVCEKGYAEGGIHPRSLGDLKGKFEKEESGGVIDTWIGHTDGVVDTWNGHMGVKPANFTGMAEMDRPRLVIGREGLVEGDVFAWTSEEDPVERRRRLRETGGRVVVMVVGMRDQERALKRSRSMINAYRDNLVELQGAVVKLHQETELEKGAILEMEQQIVRKQAEHHDIQKKADEVLRELEAMRSAVQERRAALSLRFDEQYARVDSEEAKIRCSSIRCAVQILAGSQHLLDEAENEVIACLQDLIEDGEVPS